ncbi:MAG: beta-ketoacyl synthase [Tannerella sp.]|jgi:3-oxoacyl-[acyl-carrier-protein] synthase-1|nr:beta-ketoacyl synthase [Tannerella sp.]
MTTLLSDNIISALGFTTDENVRKVRDGVSGLLFFDGQETGVSEPFVASAIDGAALDSAFYTLPRATEKRYTRLEKAVILSVTNALKDLPTDPAGERVLFILSTTKGNVCLLDSTESEGYEPEQVYLWRSAERIAGYFGNPNTPLVVSNACISGACALIAAQRALQAGRYEYVIVAGADMLSRFIIAGFQSFKALSQEACKPFDARRSGLNIGEAAATLILTEKPAEALQTGEVVLTAGAVCNDANHISGPSRTGEGAYLALKRVLAGINADELAFVNAHGTATLYNDEMEAVAIHRAALQNVPVTSLKGYFGHVLGSAGILESIVSTRALREGIVLKTRGYDTPGVSRPLRIATRTQPVKGCRCINMLSGFGGCNAALLYTLKCEE